MSHKYKHIKRKTPLRYPIALGFFTLGLIAKLYNEAHPIVIESHACQTGIPDRTTIDPFLFRLLKYEATFKRPSSGKYAISTAPPTLKVRVTGEGKYVNTIDFKDGMTGITLEAKNKEEDITESLSVTPTVLTFMFGLQMRSLIYEHTCIPPEPQVKIPPNRELRSYATLIPYANRSYGLPRRNPER